MEGKPPPCIQCPLCFHMFSMHTVQTHVASCALRAAVPTPAASGKQSKIVDFMPDPLSITVWVPLRQLPQQQQPAASSQQQQQQQMGAASCEMGAARVDATCKMRDVSNRRRCNICQMRASSCELLDARCELPESMRHARCEMRRSGVAAKDAKCDLRDASCSMRHARCHSRSDMQYGICQMRSSRCELLDARWKLPESMRPARSPVVT